MNADAVPFPFRSGVTAIDLTATYAWHGRKQGLDRLDTVEELARWISESGLPLPEGDVTAHDVADVHRLRDAVYDVASVSAFGRPARQSSVDTLNAFAESAVGTARLFMTDASFGARITVSFPDLLSSLARETIALLTGPHAHKIRECALPQCWVLFVDKSRSNNRRWCSVHCGQKVTAQNYRSRRKSAVA